MNLYEITNEYLHLQEAMENEELTEKEYADMLECMDFELENKVDGYCYVMKNIDATAKALKAEADKLNARRKVLEKRLERLQKTLVDSMKVIGKEKIKGQVFGIKIGARPSVKILDETRKFSEDVNKYVTVKTVTTREWNKVAITEAIKSGEVLDFAVLDRSKLQITTG